MCMAAAVAAAGRQAQAHTAPAAQAAPNMSSVPVAAAVAAPAAQAAQHMASQQLRVSDQGEARDTLWHN